MKYFFWSRGFFSSLRRCCRSLKKLNATISTIFFILGLKLSSRGAWLTIWESREWHWRKKIIDCNKAKKSTTVTGDELIENSARGWPWYFGICVLSFVSNCVYKNRWGAKRVGAHEVIGKDLGFMRVWRRVRGSLGRWRVSDLIGPVNFVGKGLRFSGFCFLHVWSFLNRHRLVQRDRKWRGWPTKNAHLSFSWVNRWKRKVSKLLPQRMRDSRVENIFYLLLGGKWATSRFRDIRRVYIPHILVSYQTAYICPFSVAQPPK